MNTITRLLYSVLILYAVEAGAVYVAWWQDYDGWTCPFYVTSDGVAHHTGCERTGPTGANGLRSLSIPVPPDAVAVGVEHRDASGLLGEERLPLIEARWTSRTTAALTFVQTDAAPDAIITINGNFFAVATTGQPGTYTVEIPAPGSVDYRHRPCRGSVLCAGGRCAAPLPAPPGTVFLPLAWKSP